LPLTPGQRVVLSYKMPAYQVGSCRLYIGAWKHGVSVYGWKQGRDAGFTTRHPELTTSTGTIRLRPEDAAGISDEEFRDLVRSALTPGQADPAQRPARNPVRGHRTMP
jgi:hypothetical protein